MYNKRTDIQNKMSAEPHTFGKEKAIINKFHFY